MRTRRRGAGLLLALVTTAVLASACGGGTSGVSGATRLHVDATVTRAGTTVHVLGTLRCGPGPSRGTGDLVTRAAAACRRLDRDPRILDRVGGADRLCSQIYGGPQQARITGTVAGRAIDVTIRRTDGCGVADWNALEWLLGAPER